MEGNGFADRASLLGAKARRYTEAEILGKKYRFQSLNEREKSEYDARPLDKSGNIDQKKVSQQKRRLIVATLVDGAGTRILTDADLPLLEEIDGAITGALYDAAHAHCGIGKDGVAEQQKNSETTHADASPSSSPTNSDAST